MCLKKSVMGETLHELLICEKNCLSINIEVFNNSPTTLKKFRYRCYRHCGCHQVIIHSVAGNHKLLIPLYICPHIHSCVSYHVCHS